jgi:hypothetical protein
MFTIFRYSGEGHDVVTPEDMREAIHSNGGVKGVIASVVSVDRQYESKTVTKIPNISLHKSPRLRTTDIFNSKEKNYLH